MGTRNDTVIESHLSVRSGLSRARTRTACLTDRDANDCAIFLPPQGVGFHYMIVLFEKKDQVYLCNMTLPTSDYQLVGVCLTLGGICTRVFFQRHHLEFTENIRNIPEFKYIMYMVGNTCVSQDRL